MVHNGQNPFMSSCTPVSHDPYLSQSKVNIVVYDENFFCSKIKIIDAGSNGFAALVHIGERAKQYHRLVLKGRPGIS
jgi:hypothetical protein